jgi:uncharacterized delta-60 repeat protein
VASLSTAPPGEREQGNALAVDSFGRVLVGGGVQNNEPTDNNGGWALVRFKADGTPDSGFGVNGVAKAPGLFGPTLGDFGGDIRALALVPGTGKIIAGGVTGGSAPKFTIARFNDNGSLDMTFGPADTGFVTADFSGSTVDDLKDIAVSPGGAITAVGGAGLDTALVRWDSDGNLDPSFDGPTGTGNGMFTDHPTGTFGDYRDVEVEPSGAVRAVGTISAGAEANWIVARYTAGGARDASFNGTGFTTTNFPGQGSDLGQAQVLVDGTLYVFGSIDADPGTATERDFGVTAFDPATGAALPGTTFQASVPGNQNLFEAALQRVGGSSKPSDERFLMVGTGEFAASGGALLMRLRRVGGTGKALELDPEFGAGGIVASITPPSGTWGSVAADGSDRVVVGGELGIYQTADFSAARFLDLPDSPGGGAAADVTAATISRAKVTPAVWAVNPRGHAEVRVSRTRVKRGTVFSYTLSEPARMVFRIERKAKGRRVGRKCAPATRRNRARRACTRYVLFGSFAQASKAGANRRTFSGKIGPRTLRPASYRATLTATDPSGNVSKPKRVSFKIVRG